MPNVLSIVPRDDSGSSTISTSTIIIIAVVAASVVALVFALFAWRFFARQFRRAKVPLPPVQDLAHHREQQLVSLTDQSPRPVTWIDPLPFQQKPRVYSSHFLSVSGSSASLIRSSPDHTTSRGPTRESSWVVEDATSAESSPYPTPLITDDLLPPNPAFLPPAKNPHNSMTSVVSTSSDGISDVQGSPAPVPTSPSDVTHSAESSPSSQLPAVRPRPPRASRSRTRPTSVISSSGTINSIKTAHSVLGNTIRGPAHSIHSNIQIVLPAPLAPQLYSPPDGLGVGRVPGMVQRSVSLYSAGDRRSVADQWVMVGSRSQSSTLSASGPRPPYHRSSSSLSVVSGNKARRAHSQSSISPNSVRGRSLSPGHMRSESVSVAPQFVQPYPPVPPLPSPYRNMNMSADQATYVVPSSMSKDEFQRGRPLEPAILRMPESPSAVAKSPPPSAFNMPQTRSPAKLRKSRSGSRRGRS